MKLKSMSGRSYSLRRLRKTINLPIRLQLSNSRLRTLKVRKSHFKDRLIHSLSSKK